MPTVTYPEFLGDCFSVRDLGALSHYQYVLGKAQDGAKGAKLPEALWS